MITIPLSLVLDRGVTLETAEAVAIVQSLTQSSGVPSLDNVEIDSTGRARCRSGGGRPTVATLASLLDCLLPAAGVPGALRYTVARGMGAVEAPPFPSITDFSRALSRFERSSREDEIRRLLSRARPAKPVVPVRRSYVRPVLYVTAALLISALAGFEAELVRSERLDASPAATPPAQLMPPAPSVAPLPQATTLPAVRGTSGAAPRHVDRLAVTTSSPAPVRALPAGETKAFSPAFSSAGTALFFQSGGSHDPSSAIAYARLDGSPTDDLRIVRIVDDGSRNYHAQPSPDGHLIAFDSDRDGERGVYIAQSDGTHVRRVSGDGYAALPSWSPDGTKLAFVRGEPGAPSVWNLWIQPVAGGTPQRVTEYRYGQTWAASWFPDGRRLAYSHEDELTILDLTTSRARHVASPVPGRLVRTPAVSPDGSRIVFQVFRMGAWMLNVRDGTMECVLADPTAEEFAWAPDGRRFAYHSRRDDEWGVYIMTTSPAAP